MYVVVAYSRIKCTLNIYILQTAIILFVLCSFNFIQLSSCLSSLISFGYRKILPSPMVPRHDFNIWSVLKNCIGKELSKITMPAVFNEPLTFLQRMTEYMEYARLLRMAAEQDDPIERLKYVAGELCWRELNVLCMHTLVW